MATKSNSMPDLTEDEMKEKIAGLRSGFEEKYKANIEAGNTYDECDVTRLREDDSYAQCFVYWFMEKDGGLGDAVEKVDKVFVFRKSIGLNEVKEDSFPAELTERDFLYWKGVNKQNQEILHFRVVKHKKGHIIDDVKKFIAYHLDQYQRKNTGRRVVLIFDFTGAGVTNMDMDIVKYLISCFTNHFPYLLSYILMYELPFLLSAAWKVIQTLLSEGQRKKLKLVKKKDLPTYIDDDQLEALDMKT